LRTRGASASTSQLPRLLEAEAATREIKAFAEAAPDRQPDAE
jgi:maleylpyruvate isomerase